MNHYAQRPKETPMMTTPFRDETETLRAQLTDAHAEITRLTAKPAEAPTRWGIVDWSGSDEIASISLAVGVVIVVLYAIVCLASFVVGAHIPFSWPMEQRALIVSPMLVALWCLAFVRRVPR